MTAMSNYFEDEIADGTFRSDPIIAWPSDTVVAVGDRCYGTVGDGNIYECTARAGDFKTGVSEPTWQTTFGATTTDDQITWPAYVPGQVQGERLITPWMLSLLMPRLIGLRLGSLLWLMTKIM